MEIAWYLGHARLLHVDAHGPGSDALRLRTRPGDLAEFILGWCSIGIEGNCSNLANLPLRPVTLSLSFDGGATWMEGTMSFVQTSDISARDGFMRIARNSQT